MSKELAKTYDPKGIEERLYTKWMDNGYFHAKVNPDKKPFTIVMPPPNVTGQLHMGHALDETMQDILIRFKRMQGYEALWQPGTDHAAIATEVKVIDKLKKEGIDKHDIGREEFLKHAWAWKEEYGGKIINQLKNNGAYGAVDESRSIMDAYLKNGTKRVIPGFGDTRDDFDYLYFMTPKAFENLNMDKEKCVTYTYTYKWTTSSGTAREDSHIFFVNWVKKQS